MDSKRKKELLREYQNRKPEMGVISFRCKATGETFLGTSTDTKVGITGTTAKLNMDYHPNRRLLELWRAYGEKGFEISVLKILKYEDPKKDHSRELEELREECFAEDPQARRIWK